MVSERKSTHHRRGSCGALTGERGSERRHRRPSRKPLVAGGGRVFFCGRISQHMERTRAVDWLAGGAMLLAAASWGIVASLLAGG